MGCVAEGGGVGSVSASGADGTAIGAGGGGVNGATSAHGIPSAGAKQGAENDHVNDTPRAVYGHAQSTRSSLHHMPLTDKNTSLDEASASNKTQEADDELARLSRCTFCKPEPCSYNENTIKHEFVFEPSIPACAASSCRTASCPAFASQPLAVCAPLPVLKEPRS